jgi:hypothetical protein
VLRAVLHVNPLCTATVDGTHRESHQQRKRPGINQSINQRIVKPSIYAGIVSLDRESLAVASNLH